MTNDLSQYQKRHIQYVNNKVAKAIVDNKLVDKGEKVLVAVSGGKDSLVLLEVLSTLRRYNFLDFELEAIHIDIEEVPYKVSKQKLLQMCEELGVKISFISAVSGIEENGEKPPCFVCSWHRRKAIFDFSEKNGFHKVAMGHHMDDAVETLLINISYHGNISSIPARLEMFDGKITLIRPLILLTNKDTKEYANIRKFPKQTKSCPFENKTRRDTARRIIDSLKEIHPKAVQNIFRSMGNIDEDYLPRM